MSVTKSLMGAVTATMLLLSIAPSSANATIMETTFDFFGKCDDCAGLPVGFGIIEGPIQHMDTDMLVMLGGPFHQTGDGMFENVFGSLTVLDFVAGMPMNNMNFGSFTYDGSSILPSFTVAMGDMTSFSGALDADGNVVSDVSLSWNSGPSPLGMMCGPICTLSVEMGGDWSIGPVSFLPYYFMTLDVGEAGTFAGAPIPEPGTLALFGLGLAGLGFARRRKAA